MNQTYHLGTEVVVTLIVVVYFQLRVGGLRSDLDAHIKKYEADQQEIHNAINNLHAQMNMLNQRIGASLMGNMQPQDSQYAYPPTARAPQQQLPAPNPQGNPNPYQGAPRSQAPRPQSPPPRGSREEFMASQHQRPMAPPAGAGGPPPGRQIPGMPQNVQVPPSMGHQQKFGGEDDTGGGAYSTIDAGDEDEMFTGGKKGSLKAMASMMESARRGQIESVPRD